MICFQISIFDPLETARSLWQACRCQLWFAFKLVSLIHWKQPLTQLSRRRIVVICFQISIFDPLETAIKDTTVYGYQLWFAFKLVSLIHWKQPLYWRGNRLVVVICFQISIFDPLETARRSTPWCSKALWFAFKLVSLIHWKQHIQWRYQVKLCCDLLSN